MQKSLALYVFPQLEETCPHGLPQAISKGVTYRAKGEMHKQYAAIYRRLAETTDE